MKKMIITKRGVVEGIVKHENEKHVQVMTAHGLVTIEKKDIR